MTQVSIPATVMAQGSDLGQNLKFTCTFSREFRPQKPSPHCLPVPPLNLPTFARAPSNIQVNIYLGIEMAGVFVVIPHPTVVAIRDPEACHPVFPAAVASTFSQEPGDQGGRSDIEL